MAIPILLFVTGHALLLLLLLSPVTAQPPSPDSNYYGYNTNITPSVGVIVIVLVVSLFLLGFFSMYIRHCSGDSDTSDPTLRHTNHTGRSRTAPVGLDNSVIASFPTFDYSAVKSLHIGKGALECAVCLNEFEDDETLRLIPKCDHVFHPDCIDMWLVSHTTCPVCRAELTPQPGESVRASNLGQIPEAHVDGVCNDTIIDVAGHPVSVSLPGETELMDRPLNPAALPPLNRSRTRRNSSGRPKWLAVLSRSNSTGHVAIRQGEDVERFTLRLPEDVRREIISGKLNRANSSVALPRGGSSRRGPRSGPGGLTGEGSSRGRMFGSWAGRSDRWGFSMALPFFTRGASVWSPKVVAAGGRDGGSSVRSSKAGDSVHASTTVSDTNLPPV